MSSHYNTTVQYVICVTILTNESGLELKINYHHKLISVLMYSTLFMGTLLTALYVKEIYF